ncbi:MAG: peptide chain release factor N(5)-glutamine methyltransferase [Rikenellaceae bacterium]|nr:peptide chain release factor N(5)-glutamine methyltransferase [Rikenellaceae bacterium]MDE7356709.1 peptide chain release factor N(5)-glutamine methyltransferase [Rikenellaceae bacterium]
MTLSELYSHISASLSEVMDRREAAAVSMVLLDHFETADRTDLIAHPERECVASQYDVESALTRIKQGEPVRYVTGYTFFMGRRFSVDNNVLIPRPETEELVSMIAEQWRGVDKLRLTDIATGSGVIAITLAQELGAEALGLDISAGALAVAQENSRRLGCRQVRFCRCDILKCHSLDMADIIVSNPPYIRHSERNEMSNTVLEHEPHLALFVPDNDPLLFYRKIATLAAASLSPSGMLYFEINEAFGAETADVCVRAGLSDVKIYRDMFGKERFVSAVKK